MKNFSNRELFANIDAQLDGDTATLNLIKVNDSYCVNMVNIGFDCEVVRESDNLKRYKFIPPGSTYLLGVAIVFFRRLGKPMKITFDDGEVIERDLTLTAIGNGKFCGDGFKALPLAQTQDGLIDICIIEKVSKSTFISLVGS